MPGISTSCAARASSASSFFAMLPVPPRPVVYIFDLSVGVVITFSPPAPLSLGFAVTFPAPPRPGHGQYHRLHGHYHDALTIMMSRLRTLARVIGLSRHVHLRLFQNEGTMMFNRYDVGRENHGSGKVWSASSGIELEGSRLRREHGQPYDYTSLPRSQI